MKKFLLVALASIVLTACSDDSAQYSELNNVVYDEISKRPSVDRIVTETNYLHLEFMPENLTTESTYLLDAKKLIPALVNQYPDVNQFFIGIKDKGTNQYVLKMNFDRSRVEGVDFNYYKVAELKPLMSDYWSQF